MKIPLLLLLACVSACVHLACSQERAHIFVNQTLSQSEAQKYCQDNHGNLSSILTPADRHKLLMLSSSNSHALGWISLKLGPQNWTWADGSKATYFNWSLPKEGCAAVGWGGYWRKIHCNNTLSFLCQDTMGRYEVHEVRLNWAAALAYCNKNNMMLAHFGNRSSWMELQLSLYRWVWVGQPQLYCALIDPEGGWRDAQCDDRHWSVCAGEGQTHELVKNSTTWSEAQRRCESKNMRLVTIHNTYDNTLLRNTIKGLKEKFWIGLSNNPWRWPDGTSAEQQNWAQGQPDNYPGYLEECVVMRNGELADVPCSRRLPFFCEMKPVETLKVVSAPATWEEALLHCRGLGGDLARVGGRDDQMLVQQIVLGTVMTHVWTGLRFLAGEWLWVSGGELGYLHWGESWGEQKCPLHHCGAVERNSGFWVPRSCDEELPFLCQLP